MPAFLRGRINAYQLQQAFLTAPPETTGAPRRLSPLLPAEGQDQEDHVRSPGNRVARFSTPPGEDLMDTLSRKLERIMGLDSGLTSGASSVYSPRSSTGGGRERKHNSASVKTIARPSTGSSQGLGGSPRRAGRSITHGGELGNPSAEEVYHNQEERNLEMQAERALHGHGHGAGGLGPAELPSTPARAATKNLPPLDDHTAQNSCAVHKQLQPRPPVGGTPCGTQIHICNSALAYFNGSLHSTTSVVGSQPRSAPVDDARGCARARSWRLPPLAEQQKDRKKQNKLEKFMTHTGIFPGELRETPPLLEGSQLND